MMKQKKKKNRLLLTYTKYENKLLNGFRRLHKSEEDIKQYDLEFCQHCLYMINEQRKDKDKTAKEQANENQLEVIEYLENKIKELND